MAGAKKAKTKRMKKSQKHYPVLRNAMITAGPAANTLIDGASIFSRLNRRLMRYGRYYEFKVDVRPDYAGTAIEVYALRDDWMVQKGFQMAYQQYLKNTADERSALGNQVARWEDFRVEPGLTLSLNNADPVELTGNGGYTVLNAGTFDLANVVDSSGVRRTFTWGVPGATQFGILQEYDKAGNAQLDPSSTTVGTAAYSEIDSEVNDLTHDDLQLDNREPPYDQNGVHAGSPWIRLGVLGTGAGGVQRLSTGFFTAPCGLVLLKGFSEVSDDYSVTIEAKSGDYKGVHAPSMLE